MARIHIELFDYLRATAGYPYCSDDLKRYIDITRERGNHLLDFFERRGFKNRSKPLRSDNSRTFVLTHSKYRHHQIVIAEVPFDDQWATLIVTKREKVNV